MNLQQVSPIVLHIPHSSTFIPQEYRNQFIISDEYLEKMIQLMTDHYTDELFVSTDNLKESAVIFPVSRICVDPERFRDDSQEIMSEKGMGVLYTHSHDGTPIRKELAIKERLVLLNNFYEPHHKRLETIVSERLRIDNECLIIDCHSFPGKALPYEFDQSADRPDICIGTDEFHTPKWLTHQIVDWFEDNGFKTAINKPFTGALVPGKYYRSNKNVLSILIEVNRKLYMDEDHALKNENFKKVQQTIGRVINSLQNGFNNETRK